MDDPILQASDLYDGGEYRSSFTMLLESYRETGEVARRCVGEDS